MVNFWKLAYKSVKEQRDQHKVELLQCKSELHYYRDELESYKTNLKQRKAERESMISDFQKKLDLISILKEENERKDKLIEALKASESNLWHSSRESEEENRKLETQKIAFQLSYKQVYEENKDLKHENKALRLQADTYFEEWQNEKLKGEN